MSPEQKIPQSEVNPEIERLQNIIKPGVLNTLKLFVKGLAEGGGPIRPSEMRDRAESELENLQSRQS